MFVSVIIGYNLFLHFYWKHACLCVLVFMEHCSCVTLQWLHTGVASTIKSDQSHKLFIIATNESFVEFDHTVHV